MYANETYRKYPDDPTSSIYRHYYNKNTRQTLSLVNNKVLKYKEGFFNGDKSITITDALLSLNDYHDPSDPDIDSNNLIHRCRRHRYQTAERIRKDYPDLEWFQIVGLIHDVGKILFFANEPDWCVVGDTFRFPAGSKTGCKYSKKCVYAQFFENNPEQYSDLGIYSEKCGLDNLKMTWGHDEYLYRVLIDNNTILPLVAHLIIRYHSFYPLHRYGAYSEFLNNDDKELIPWLCKFSEYDLYSKHDEFTLTDDIKNYYDNLLKKYFPDPLIW